MYKASQDAPLMLTGMGQYSALSPVPGGLLVGQLQRLRNARVRSSEVRVDDKTPH